MARAPRHDKVPAKAAKPEPALVDVRSIMPEGVFVHLGDGRRIGAGESASVTPALAAMLRESGMVK